MGIRFLLTDARNSFDFFLREKLPFSRQRYSESGINLPRELLKLSSADAHQVEALVDRYQLTPYLDHLSYHSFLDNIVHLLLLDSVSKYMSVTAEAKVLDVGSKNFSYCVAIYEFLKQVHRSQSGGGIGSCFFDIQGIELDVKRMYSSFYSRETCGEYYCRLIPRAKLLHGDVLRESLSGPYTVITHFYPFIEMSSLLDFGLPSKYFRPIEIFRRLFQCLEPGGRFFLANTTRDEYLHSRSLLEACQFVHLGSASISNGLTQDKPIYASVFTK